MAQRKRHNPIAALRHELPFVARIKAGRRHTREDQAKIEDACRRIGLGRWHAQHGWREDHGWLICWFATATQAAAMAAWANENEMHREPPTRQEALAEEAERCRRAAEAEAAMQTVIDRAIAEGICRQVVLAFLRALRDGKNEPYAGHVAHAALIRAWADRPHENTREHAEAMVRWARTHHGAWFDRVRRG